MADNQNDTGPNWLSLAASILPAAAGAIMGARSGGIGVLPGALYGVGNAARYSIDDDRERAKLNTEIAYKNSLINQGQQRTDLESRRIDLEQQNYARLDRVADAQIKNYELENKKHQFDLDSALKTQQGQDEFIKQLPPDQQAAFAANPDKAGFIKQYYADKQWEAKTNNSAGMLQKMGMSPEQARMLGPTGTAHLMSTIMESRMKPREPYAVHYDPTSGLLIKYNKENGAVSTQEIAQPKSQQISPEKRSAIAAEMRKQYTARFPTEAKLAADTGDWSKFDEWSASPSGQITGAYLSGQITMDQANLAQQSITRQEKELTASATDAMRKSNPNMSDQQFQEFMKSPKAGPMLDQWKNYVKQQDRRGVDTRLPTERGKPVVQNNDGSVSTERTITIEADGKHYLIPTIVNGKAVSKDEAVRQWRAGKNTAVGVYGSADEAEKAAKNRSNQIGQSLGRGKRPSLDQIFGG